MQKDANLVELEKCCRTHIFLQNFVLIQPRTSPLKFVGLAPLGGAAGQVFAPVRSPSWAWTSARKMHFRKMHFRKMHFRKMHFRKMHFEKCIFIYFNKAASTAYSDDPEHAFFSMGEFSTACLRKVDVVCEMTSRQSLNC